jgi:hypothetical protein
MAAAARDLPIDTPPMRTASVTGGLVRNVAYTIEEDGSILAEELASGITRVASPASARPFAGSGAAVVLHKVKLFFFGGTGAAAGKVQIYDTSRDRWKVGRAMPFAASDSAATVLNGKAYVLGGVVDGQASAAAARYDLAKNKWNRLPDLPLARVGAYADADRINVYLGAGRATNAGGSADVTDRSHQILDLKTLTWTAYGAPGFQAHPPVIAGG